MIGPEVISIFLVEIHSLIMVLGDFETELALDGCAVGVEFGLVYHAPSLFLSSSHAAITTPEGIKCTLQR